MSPQCNRSPIADALLLKLIEVHGCARHLAPALQSAERFLRQAHSIDEMVPTYRRLLAS
jgi:hypothetical protein